MTTTTTYSGGRRRVRAAVRSALGVASASTLLATGLIFATSAPASAATLTVVSGMTLHMNTGATYAASASTFAGVGPGSAWTVTVPQDTATTIATAHYALTNTTVAMTGANTATAFPVTFVSGPGTTVNQNYGTLAYVSSVWTVTPASTQTFETPGTWVLQSAVSDSAGAQSTLQLTLNVVRLAPTLVTGAATNVSSTGATLNGSLTNLGVDSVTTAQFCYSTSSFISGGCRVSNGTIVAAAATAATSAHSATLTGLLAQTKYYFEFEAIDATTSTQLHGGVQTFTSAATSLLTQTPLVLTSLSGTAGSTLTLRSSGGSGSGAVTYALTSAGSAGCSIAGESLIASSAGTCTVTATKAADATYLAATSAVTTLTFAAARIPVTLKAFRVNGFVWVARTSIVTITGSGFYSKPTITSNQPGTNAVVIHDRGNALVVRVVLVRGAATGWHVFTITLANGHSVSVRYMVRTAPMMLKAFRVIGYVWVGRTSMVTITGGGFYNKPTIVSNVSGVRAVVIRDRGNALVVRVVSVRSAAQGGHVFRIILANGRSTTVHYVVR